MTRLYVLRSLQFFLEKLFRLTYSVTGYMQKKGRTSKTCRQHYSNQNVKQGQAHFFKLNWLLAGLVILKGRGPARVPAVPALTTIYLYSSRWQLVLCMPTDCQWREGMARFQLPNLSDRARGGAIHCWPPTDADNQLLMLDACAGSLITETTERLLEASRQRKHARPAGIHSLAK